MSITQYYEKTGECAEECSGLPMPAAELRTTWLYTFDMRAPVVRGGVTSGQQRDHTVAYRL